MMKIKIVVLGISVLVLIGLSGCDQWLSIQPESQVILKDYWKSQEDVEAVLASCYNGLITDDIINRMIVWGELRSDNLAIGKNSPDQDMKDILAGKIISSNGYCNWGGFYKVVNYCNTILYYAPQVIGLDVNFTEDHLHRVQSEALTLRALSYFYLVRAFKEVPWIEEPSIDNTQNYARPKDTEQTIINNIIRDLLIAQKYAQTDYGRTDYNKGRITLDVVNSLLADVYLWNQQYDLCAQTCDLVLADKNLKLVKTVDMFTSVFYQGNSSESIFELQFNGNSQINHPTQQLYGLGSGGTFTFGKLTLPLPLAYFYDIDKKLKTGAYSPFNYKVSETVTEGIDDVRAFEFCFAPGGTVSIFKYTGYQVIKFSDGTYGYSYRTNSANWIVYRLSDVMLMKAEALVQLDGTENRSNALSIVNQTYLRSNPTADSLRISNYSDKSTMEQLVLRERQRELLFEGKRWFDLVRMSRRQGSTSTLNGFANHKKAENSAPLGATVLDAMYMPIPKSELDANPNMVQNEFYRETTTLTK
jgi:hypothetical protein